MVEEIVLEGKPFDTQKKYLRKFSENEGMDYDKLEDAIIDLIETLKEIISSSSQSLIKLAAYQCREAHVSEGMVAHIVEHAGKNAGVVDLALFPVTVNGKHGMIDAEGNIRIQPKYESTGLCFCDGLTTVTLNGKDGYIDKMGKMIIEPRFDYAGDFHDGIAIVRADDEFYLIDRNGNYVSEAMHYAEVRGFYDGLSRIKDGEKFGFINKSGNIAIYPQFIDAGDFHDGRAQVRIGTSDHGVWAFIDKSGNVVFERNVTYGKSIYDFSEGLLVDEKVFVKKEKVRVGLFRTEERKTLYKKYGYLDLNGNTAIEYRFDDARPFSCGFACVEMDGKTGFIDRAGKLVITPQYGIASDFSCGMAAVAIDDKWGFVDESGQLVIHPQFDHAGDFTEDGLAIVNVNGKVGAVNIAGELVIAPQFYGAFLGFDDGLCRVVLDEGFTQYGYVNRFGKVVFLDS